MDSQESDSAQSYDDISQLCDEYRRLWEVRTKPPGLARFIDGTVVVSRETLFRALLNVDIAERRTRGLKVSAADYSASFPQWAEIVRTATDDEFADLLAQQAVTLHQVVGQLLVFGARFAR